MKVVNVMISKVMGGIEQAFLDYNEAFSQLNYEVVSVIDKKNVVADKIPASSSVLTIAFNKLNLLLIPYLYLKLKKFTPDLIIVHQRKAIPLFKIVAKMLQTKLVGVAHDPKIKHLEKCDAIFSITQNQKEEMIRSGLKNIPIHVVPNMIALPRQEEPYHQFHKPVVIGTFGRFDPMKGFCDFIDALAILKQKGIPFHAIIGGKNNTSYYEEECRILQKVEDLNLEKEVEFCGWVYDKPKFFSQIDIFVLPSLFEPFGIVMLEAAMAKKSMVCSDAEGPKEVWHNSDAVKLFNKGNVEMLADNLAELINNPAQAQNMAEKAYKHVKEHYSVPLVTKILQKALAKVVDEK